MKRILLLAGFSLIYVTANRAAESADSSGSIVLPSPTNAIRFRLYTNAAPDASHLFNTFEIEAFGEKLLAAPTSDSLHRLQAVSPTNACLQSLIVNGLGPRVSGTNGFSNVQEYSSTNWQYVVLDATAAFGGQLTQYTRGILYVRPDLFVVHDHLVAKQPANFLMYLHPPAATRVDPVWRHLLLDTPKASLRVAAPSGHILRAWERVESGGDALLPGTVTMRLGPTNALSQLDFVTVYAVQPGGGRKDYTFKLIESNNAVGARIHRDGLPTVVAFRTTSSPPKASVSGFEFEGPVGVGIFEPKPKSR